MLFCRENPWDWLLVDVNTVDVARVLENLRHDGRLPCPRRKRHFSAFWKGGKIKYLPTAQIFYYENRFFTAFGFHQ
jgi:hypothetical protein